MSKIACPLVSNPRWIALVEEFGEDTAYRLFYENSYDIPTLAEVNKYLTGVLNEDTARILGVIDEQLEGLNKKINTYRSAETESNSKYTKARINELRNTIEDVIKRKNELQYSRAVGTLIVKAKEDLERINEYVFNKANRKDPDFLKKLHQYKGFIEDHKKIAVPEFGYGKRKLTADINQISNLTANISNELYKEFINHTRTMVKERTTNRKLLDNPEQLENLLKEAVDVSAAEMWFLDNYSTPDTIVANVVKSFRDAQQETFNRRDEFERKFKTLGNRLAKAMGGKATYDWMIEKGGRYLQKHSVDYENRKSEVIKKGRDINGQYKQYNLILDLATASPEQLVWNQELQKVKDEIRAFHTAEIIDENTGEVQDGENHRYSAAFKEARANFQELNDSLGYWAWVRKDGVSDEDYNAFLETYFQEEVETWVAVRDDEEYKGRVALRNLRFPRNEFIEVTEKWINPRYQALYNDTSSLGAIKREFYEEWVNAFEEGDLAIIPPTIRRKMVGRLPVVMKDFMDAATGRGESFFTTVSKQFRKFFSNDLHSKAALTDSQGFVKNDIPIFYVASLKSQERIDELTLERDKLNAADPKYTELSNLINAESKKLDEQDIETDLVESLIKFNAMAENYEIMKNLEDSLLAVKEVIENREYIKKGGGKIAGKESNTAKMFQNWMNLVFYQSDEADDTTIANITKRVRQYTSFKGVALNPASSINNIIMGNINQKNEAFSGLYYSRENYAKTFGMYNKDYLPNIFKELSFSNPDGTPYKITRPYSKYSAMIRKLNYISGAHSDESAINSFGYALSAGGEFYNQSRMGIAMTMDYKVKTSTGEEISLYDAFQYNEADGSLTLREDVKLPEQEFRNFRNKVKETASVIHGRYSVEEKNVLQSYVLGKMVSVFHKWVIPAFQSRFSNRYHQESLGVEVEGSYRTLLQFLQHMKQHDFNMRSTYDSLDDLGKANMRKISGEIGFFLASFLLYSMFQGLAAGLDEDEIAQRTFMNYMSYQASRNMHELTTFLNPMEYYNMAFSPIASLGAVKDLGEMVMAGAGIPYNLTFGDSEDMYYSRGIYKGNLKFMKELRDVTPGVRSINFLTNLQQQSSFFISTK